MRRVNSETSFLSSHLSEMDDQDEEAAENTSETIPTSTSSPMASPEMLDSTGQRCSAAASTIYDPYDPLANIIDNTGHIQALPDLGYPEAGYVTPPNVEARPYLNSPPPVRRANRRRRRSPRNHPGNFSVRVV